MSGRIALLWHLHQPDYRDPASGRPVMPWVRLHALRGYRDILVESVERRLAVTINVVPSLLDQLLAYAEGATDRHLELVRMPAEALLDGLVDEAVATLPSGHPMITRAHPAYVALRERLGAPTVADLRDLQVWSTLSWFGATARRDWPELRLLAHKGRGFDEDDKAQVLAVQSAILSELPARLLLLGAAEGPRIACSPYFHPILPLLVDARHARRCMPDLPDEVAFAWPGDALRQLRDARARVREVCGVEPIGLWPSEGSVSPEVVALAGEAGFRWLATDRGVLARSERAGGGREGAWDLGHAVAGFFRDTELSDRIGFRYAEQDPERAADDLVGAATAQAGDGVLLVALDGENPWESYADAGGAFRQALYRRLERGPLRAVTLDAAAAEAPVGTVSKLWTGSWIGADFKIWIGHPDDRRAWRLLAEVRRAADEAGEPLREVAMPHLLAAEGSDWFWWYGDDFQTPWSGTFDALFRAHVKAAWRALGRTPPAALDEPIASPARPSRTDPQRVLPITWPTAESAIAWAGAGELRAAEGAMARAAAVQRVQFGWGDDRALWLRIEARGRWDLPGAELRGAVARIASGSASVQLHGPDGARWPEEPVALASPAVGSLRFWEV